MRSPAIVVGLLLSVALLWGIGLRGTEAQYTISGGIVGQPAAAPLGNGFTYQGQLLLNDTPVDTPQDLQFTLFDSQAGGIQIAGPITLPQTPVSNGLFTVVMDFGAAAFNGDQRFLRIGARPGGTTGLF